MPSHNSTLFSARVLLWLGRTGSSRELWTLLVVSGVNVVKGSSAEGTP